jgi:hypothetical protein
MFAGFPFRSAAAAAVVTVLAGLTTLCALAGSSYASSFGDKFFGSPASPSGGLKPPTADYAPDYFFKQGYCPPVEVRAGTEAFTIYDRGHEDDPAFIKTLASISRTARECHSVGGSLTLKIGVAGRVVAGPKGGPGSLTLPVRIAVVRQIGTDVLYTQLFKVPVTLAPPDFGADYQQVFDQISFPVTPDDRDFLVYVGFDEGKPKTKAK